MKTSNILQESDKPGESESLLAPTIHSPLFRGFILGSRRSGSNLLRAMLNNHPDISSPHPPHILHGFKSLFYAYRDLDNDSSWQRLIADVVHYVNLSPVPMLMDDSPIPAEEVISQSLALPRTFATIHDLIYSYVMWKNGKQAWVCKSNDNIHYIDDIETIFGASSKYLFLYRDGRDVSLSFRKAAIGPKHPYFCGETWVKAQQQLFDLESRVGDRVHRVKYEALLTDPKTVCQGICEFFGVEYSPLMLSYHNSKEASRTASKSSLWENITRPIMSTNCGKYLHDSHSAVLTFESVAGSMLQRLGYERHCKPLRYTADEIQCFREEEERLQEENKTARTREEQGTRDQQRLFLLALQKRLKIVH